MLLGFSGVSDANLVKILETKSGIGPDGNMWVAGVFRRTSDPAKYLQTLYKQAGEADKFSRPGNKNGGGAVLVFNLDKLELKTAPGAAQGIGEMGDGRALFRLTPQNFNAALLATIKWETTPLNFRSSAPDRDKLVTDFRMQRIVAEGLKAALDRGLIRHAA